MTRIVAGQWGGRRVRTPPGDSTRPTSDRVREAMFSSLEAELGGFQGIRVLDLFAGTGALALEALSRGAASADLVESNSRAAAVIAANVRDFDAHRFARLHRVSAERFVARPADAPYDLVLLDPPYAFDAARLADIVAAMPVGAWRTDDSVVVVERSSRDPWEWPEGVSGLRDRRYGETHLWYGR